MTWAHTVKPDGVSEWHERGVDRSPLVCVRIDGVDFSFHAVRVPDDLPLGGVGGDHTWSGIRLKPIAPLVLAWARNMRDLSGFYTITEVEVRFSPDGKSLVSPWSNVRVSSFTKLPEALREPEDASEERAMQGVLTPWDTGMRSETDAVGVQNLKGRYALVRWTIRWETRWEHRHGEVRRVHDDEPWSP